MDLKFCQRQMCFTLKKYLNLIAKNRDRIKEKDVERECLELLREIISINDDQKQVLSALRKKRSYGGDENKTPQETVYQRNPLQKEEESPLAAASSRDGVKTEGEVVNTSFQHEPSEEQLAKAFLQESALDPHSESAFPDAVNRSEREKPDDVIGQKDPEDMVDLPQVGSPERDDIDGIHNWVTSYEFMHSLGLLTIKECEEVLDKRRERHKKNALSHVFCQAMWEKQETKRKKRDWLLSSSPPQLRRKVRPNSHPCSRQASRSTSPLEGGSTSPPSSLSPPSPISPGSHNQNSQANEEVCPVCRGKGASFQCDGCGVHYHTSCVHITEEESESMSEWLCSKCETLGLRASTYNDPLNQKSAKVNFGERGIEKEKSSTHSHGRCSAN